MSGTALELTAHKQERAARIACNKAMMESVRPLGMTAALNVKVQAARQRSPPRSQRPTAQQAVSR